MALFRKFFYRKPPEGLLEISERVFVFDCCFATDVWERDEYKIYIDGIVGQLREYFNDASFMVFNFREGENQSNAANILSDYDMTVMDYPRQYENCPLLTMEMIHHFLRSSESWLSLGQRNVILMHCERGGWPVLAFMLAALLLYKKHYSGEQKTLDMIYKQAPRELLQLMLPLNPIPSQLRYLQYVSRRSVGSEWPPLDRALTLDCIIIRVIPSMDGEGGCRPIFRIYGQDPLMVADRTPKVLFSTPKRSKTVRHFKQADCELVKIDIHCHIQGDIVLECITLDRDLEHEEMLFRVMFNTAFIRSNILMLNRDEIDTLWNAKDRFPKDFRTEVLFSEMDSTSHVAFDLPAMDEKEGLPMEAFAKVQEIFSNVDWLDSNTDAALDMLQKITSSNILQEKLEILSPRVAKMGEIDSPRSTQMEHLVNGSLRSFKNENLDVGFYDGFKTRSAENKNFEGGSPQVVKNYKLCGQSELIVHERKLGSDSTQSAENEELRGRFVVSVEKEKFGLGGSPQSVKKEQPVLGYPQSGEGEKLEIGSPNRAISGSLVGEQDLEEVVETPKSNLLGSFRNSSFVALGEQSMSPSPDFVSVTKKIESQELQVALQWPSQPKIISPHVLQPSLSNPALNSPSRLSKYHNTSSFLGITALLHDHQGFENKETLPVTSSPKSDIPVSISNVSKLLKFSDVSIPSPPPPPPLFQHSIKTSAAPPPSIPALPPSVPADHLSMPELDQASLCLDLETSVHGGEQSPPFSSAQYPSSPSRISLLTAASSSSFGKSLSVPLPPPLPLTRNFSSTRPPTFPSSPSSSGAYCSSPAIKNSISTPPPTPPPLPPSPSTPAQYPSLQASSSIPSPAPPSPGFGYSTITSVIVPPSVVGSTVVASPPPPPPSPQPPQLSGPASSSRIASSAPQPPPPPGFTPGHSLCKNSQFVPPVPSPPAPSANGFSKSGSAPFQLHAAGSNGNIPPVPGPPLSAKGILHPRTGARNQAQPRKASLKPYHWLKLSRAMQGSLWAETQKPDEASKAPEFDLSELESLFSATVPTSDHETTGRKHTRRSSGPKSDKVHLIELRRSYNCEIMLSKVKVPLPDLMGSVLALDDMALDVDQVDNLIKFCPTKEEMELLKNYNGDSNNLGRCEQFFLELMQVPRVGSKLRVFSFKIQFQSQVSDLTRSLNIINSASEEVRNSVKLKRIMQTVLSLGNALNHGTARGSAVGFRLDSLLKLTDTRARNNKLTLMHYLCKVLAEKMPELLDFPKDFANLEAATKIQLKYLAEEMQAISKGLEKVVQELSASENDGPLSENFCKTLKEFLGFAESEVRSLASLYSAVGRNADALALYFGEDPARCSFEQVVSTLLNFSRMFVRAHQENCKQLEFEKKKALKEAENEKAKLSSSKKQQESANMNTGAPKESGQLIQTQ